MWLDSPAYHARNTPDRIALILADEDRKITYGQLHQLVETQASWLARQGLGRGERLAMLATNRLEHLTLLFACSRLGAIFVPLNFRLGKAELEAQLVQLEPAIFLGSGTCSLEHNYRYEDMEQLDWGEASSYEAVASTMEDTLLMLFTSGSTGQPKGVMLSAGMLQWNIINTQVGWGLRADDVSVVQMPFFHTGGYNVTCLPLLYLGGTLVMTGRFDAGQVLELIEREQITVYFAVPTMFRMIQEHPAFAGSDLSSLRFCISGGAPCPASLIEGYRQRGVPLKQGFGLTEVGPNCFAMSDEDAATRSDSVGRTMPHLQMELVDEHDQPVADGEIGELVLKGPTVCSGYWRNEAAFSAVCWDGWFHTGDLMRRDSEGFYYVVGRKKEMYISGGENVFPGEVVRQLVQHPDVIEAQVIAVPDEQWGEVGFAFLRANRPVSLSELRDFLDPLLSRYKHPRHLRILDQFPLLPNNKVDMKALQAMAVAEVHHG